MKRLSILFAIVLITSLAGACKKSESVNETATDTSVSSTAPSTTDTVATDTTARTSTSATATTDTSATSATSTAPLNDMDKDFVTSAAKGGMAEVALAQDAVSHASNPDVTSFAQKLVDDHTKANADLTSFASGRSVTLPTEIETKMKEVKERLAKLTGKSFDQAFVKQMVEDHKGAIKLFEGESKNGTDTALKTWVDGTLPTLRDHLKMAEDLQTKLAKK